MSIGFHETGDTVHLNQAQLQGWLVRTVSAKCPGLSGVEMSPIGDIEAERRTLKINTRRSGLGPRARPGDALRAPVGALARPDGAKMPALKFLGETRSAILPTPKRRTKRLVAPGLLSLETPCGQPQD